MRTDDRTARAIARDFSRSSTAGSWWAFSDDIRNALIDQAIVQHIRLADEDTPVTPRAIMELRSSVVRHLADGSLRHRSLRLEP